MHGTPQGGLRERASRHRSGACGEKISSVSISPVGSRAPSEYSISMIREHIYLGERGVIACQRPQQPIQIFWHTVRLRALTVERRSLFLCHTFTDQYDFEN